MHPFGPSRSEDRQQPRPIPLDRQILRLVQVHQGLPVSEISRRLQAGSGTVYYHLRRLQEAGDLRTLLVGRRRLVFAAGATPHPWQAAGISILRGRTANSVARAICERPGCAVREVVEKLGESPRAVHYHIKRFREAGLVESSLSWRRSLRPTPALRALLARMSAPAAGSTMHNACAPMPMLEDPDPREQTG